MYYRYFLPTITFRRHQNFSPAGDLTLVYEPRKKNQGYFYYLLGSVRPRRLNPDIVYVSILDPYKEIPNQDTCMRTHVMHASSKFKISVHLPRSSNVSPI